MPGDACDNESSDTISGGRLIITVVLNLFITVVQVAGGIISGSLSLLSDAMHNFSDVIAVSSSYIALRIGARKSTDRKTFGFKRAEILVALLNAAILMVISFFLFKEAVERLFEPVEIDGIIMVVVALAGLTANSIGVWLLRRDAGRSMNIRTAYLHLFTDALTSLAVVAGGVAIYFWEILWVDSVFTILIGIYVLRGGYQVMKEAVDILMESTPGHIDIDEIRREVEKVSGVEDIHHLHVWRMSDRDILLEGHVELSVDMPVSGSGRLLRELEEMLRVRFGIRHVTLQMEYDLCEDKAPYCH